MKTLNIGRTGLAAALGLAALATGLPSFATSYTWNSSVSSGKWDDAANWLVNGAATTGWPSSASDAAVFPANTKASVALTTSRTISNLDLSATDISLTLTQGGGSLDSSKLTATTLSLEGSNLVFTIDGVSLVASNSPMMGNASKFSITDGACFSTATLHNQPATRGNNGTTAMGDNEQGGQIYVSRGSTAEFFGLQMKNGLLEIDNSTVQLKAGMFFWAETGANQSTIRFKGKNPILTIVRVSARDNYGDIYGKEDGFNAHFEFVIPEGGFKEAPLQSGTAPYKFPFGYSGRDKTGTFAFDVSADSPANFASGSLTARLIDWSKGLDKDKITSVNLPHTTDSYELQSTTLDVTLTGLAIAVSPKIEERAWKGIDLSFATSENARELFVAYGATDGGADATKWTTAKLADLATDATSYGYLFSQTADASWGSDNFKVVRFYIVENGDVYWSKATTWYSLSASIFAAAPTAEDAGGDAITVTGEMSDYPGDTCTLKVLTGKSADALTDEWSDENWVLPSSDGSKAFSLALCETDAASARLAPGKTYSVAVVATSAGTVTTSAVMTVTTASGTPMFSGMAASVNRRTVTFSGTLSAIGFDGMTDGKADVTLWVGDEKDESALKQVGTTNTVTSAAATFKWDPITFDGFGKTYYYQFRATSTSAGGTVTTSNNTSVGSFTTTDGAVTYNWTGAAGDGVWTNPGNWEAVTYKDDCVGYPSIATSTAKFAQGTAVEFALRKDATIDTIDLSAGGASVTFRKGESVAKMPLLTVTTKVELSGKGNAFTLDGVELNVEKNDVTLGANGIWRVLNGASVELSGDNFYNKGGKVCVESGSSFSCQRHRMSDAAYLLVKDATFTAVSRTNWNSTDAANPDVIRLEGQNTVYKMTSPKWHVFCATTANAVLNLDIVVPKTGFAAAPLQSVKADSNYAIGDASADKVTGGVLNVNLIQATGDASSETVTTPLISWPGAGISKTVVREGSKTRSAMKFIWKDSSGAETADDKPIALDAEIPCRSGFTIILR